MPRIKRSVSSAPDQQAAAVYEGPDVPDGTYPAVIRSMKYRESRQKKTPQWSVFAVLDAKDKDGKNAQYDGYGAFVDVYMVEGSEVNESREKSLYTAIAGKADVEIITDDKVQGDPVVTKVGGVSPINTRVYLQLKTEYDDQYGSRQRGTWIYPDPSFRRDDQPDVEAESDPDLDAEAATEKPAPRKRAAKKTATVTQLKKAEPEPEPEAEESIDYDALTFPQARKKAAELGIETKGVTSKSQLIESIKAAVAGDTDEDGLKGPQDVHKMSDEELNTFLAELKYDPAEFDGMSRAETVELLQDEGLIRPF